MSRLEEAEKILEQQASMTRGEIKTVRRLLKEDGGIDTALKQLGQEFRSPSGYNIDRSDYSSIYGYWNDIMKKLKTEIQPELDKLNQYETEEYKEENKALKKIRRALKKLEG